METMITAKTVTKALREMGIDPQRHGNEYWWLKTGTRRNVKIAWNSIDVGSTYEEKAARIETFLRLVRLSNA